MSTMCNSCDCVEMDKCSVRGYASSGWCCDHCNFITTLNCEIITKSQTIEKEEEFLIDQIFSDLEKRIVNDLKTFKEAIMHRSREESLLLNE